MYGYALASLLLIVGIAQGIEQMDAAKESGVAGMVLAFLGWDGILPYLLFFITILWYGSDLEKLPKWLRENLAIFEYQGSIKDKQIDNTTVILLYILSFFIPLAGFIVGAIYASKDEEHYKHVGKNCLIFSVLNIVLGFIMIAVILAG
jgi:heme/copper-type cytochrome/quinol oxidase subunit 2